MPNGSLLDFAAAPAGAVRRQRRARPVVAYRDMNRPDRQSRPARAVPVRGRSRHLSLTRGETSPTARAAGAAEGRDHDLHAPLMRSSDDAPGAGQRAEMLTLHGRSRSELMRTFLPTRADRLHDRCAHRQAASKSASFPRPAPKRDRRRGANHRTAQHAPPYRRNHRERARARINVVTPTATSSTTAGYRRLSARTSDHGGADPPTISPRYRRRRRRLPRTDA